MALARFVMRSKQYLGAVRSIGTHLVMSTMVYADEVNDPSTLVGLRGLDDLEASEQEVEMAKILIDCLGGEFDPAEFTDEYRAKVLALIDQKAAGTDSGLFYIPAAAESNEVVDLMAALEASVAAAKQARARHPTANAAAAEKRASRRSARADKKASKRKPA